MFEGKNVLVCGMARSGQAAALVLRQLGAFVTASDLRTEIEWDYDPAEKGISLRLGEEPDDFVLDFDIVVISPGISMYATFIKMAQNAGKPVWSEAELAYRLCPCPMIAITGTNGKTTVTTLVGEILRRFNPKTVIAGNIGVPLTSLVTGLDEDSIVVAEISSFQLETISAFRPKISAVLNMTEDHLDRHLTMENYIAAKSRIFENQGQNDICVLNLDNAITRSMRPSAKTVFFSTKENADATIQNGALTAFGQKNILMSETRVMPENALAATAIAMAAGVPGEIIADVLREFKGVPHRCEHILTSGGVDFYNDSKATNTDAAIKALENFERPVVLIAGGYDKNTDFLPWVEKFRGRVKNLILIGQTTEKIIADCQRVGFSSYEKADTLEGAVSRARELAVLDDIVLFSPACASFDMFKNFEERGELFVKFVGKGVDN
ncbi:MAG: UDP-N-acetylmuramoyl-L-alanine--D-glutamate ligase [Defluviitaleaceae bacterium]|nr:UDP-N-acetylmuramoyl-L-alanine--D-glutamate ligase [Defluviitaleaceae bacterium]